MRRLCEEVVPLGLDFEMPEELWAMKDGTFWWTRNPDCDGSYFRVLAGGEVEILKAAIWSMRNDDNEGGFDILEHTPTRVTLSEALSGLKISVGIILVDGECRELARRYVR